MGFRKLFASKLKRRSLILPVLLVLTLGGGRVVLANFGGAPRQADLTNDIALSKGLVGWYKLDGNGKDSTPFGRDATVANTSTVANRKSDTGKALSFNGSTSSVTVNNFDSTVMTSASYAASWTLSIWAAGSTGQGAEKVLLGKHGCNGGIVTNGSNGYRFQLFDGSCSTRALIDATPSDITKWHMLTATYSNGSMAFYMDGQSLGTTSTATMNAYNNLLGIGASDNTPTWQFSGSLDDARIYNRALSQGEITALYSSYDDPLDVAHGENGLAGWWKMDGNAKDSTPNGDDGSVTSATLTSDRKGASNSAYLFNGTSYINIPDASQLDSTTGSWSFWGRVSSLPAGNPQFFLGKHDSSQSFNGINICMDNSGQLVAQIKNGSSTVAQLNYYAAALSNGSWHHYVLTFNGTSTAYLYVDGVQQASATPTSWSMSSQSMRIGKSLDTYWNGLNGSVDDVRVYKKALIPAEVSSIYNSYNSQISLGGSSGSSVQLGKGLVGEWPMNGNFKDSTPFGGNASANSGVLTTDRKTRSNSAYSYNGSNQCTTIPNSASINIETLSVAVWIKTTQSAAGISIVEKWDNSGSKYPFVLRVSSGHAYIQAWDGTNAPQDSSSVNVSDGNWHLLVGTRNKQGSMNIYVDGVSPGATTDNTTSSTTNSSNLYIGCRGALQYFDGAVDDVRIWNRALSQAEVTALYDEYR